MQWHNSCRLRLLVWIFRIILPYIGIHTLVDCRLIHTVWARKKVSPKLAHIKYWWIKKFTFTLSSKFATKGLLHTSPHLKGIAKLPCKILVSMLTPGLPLLFFRLMQFLKTVILQGSVATLFKCGELCNNSFIAHFLLSVTVENFFWKKIH